MALCRRLLSCYALSVRCFKRHAFALLTWFWQCLRSQRINVGARQEEGCAGADRGSRSTKASRTGVGVIRPGGHGSHSRF